ncbi:MAG: pyridoxal phosphate-dependent aminotransferase [Deltaproteobacteria bacterium]|jgi:aspartate aminotransferase|nr:pyridoxal phosphate-dependent aminotransferase [Deltaproteobacteria bacterium]
MPNLSNRTALIKPSPTLTLDAKVKAMKAQGIGIINLSVGEPDFQTPDHIKEAAIKAIRDGFTRYTPSEGIPELREAISRKLSLDNSLSYNPSQIVVSNGGKHALYNIMQCLFQEGDEVIIPTPYWVTYPDLVLLSGATPVFVPTYRQDGYILRPDVLARVLTPRSRGLILNSPSNPTGVVYSRENLKALAETVAAADLWVISDDIYEKLVYDQTPFVNLVMAAPELQSRVVIAHGVSKTYCMTGWRIGFLAGPEPLARAAAKLQSQMTSNPNSVAQKAALAALEGPQECIDSLREAFGRRRNILVELLRKIPGVTCPEPKGAFYVFPDFSRHFGRTIGRVKIEKADDLASVLLEECQVATVPGSGFGEKRSIRLSYAASDDELRQGLERLTNLLI